MVPGSFSFFLIEIVYLIHKLLVPVIPELFQVTFVV